MENLQLQLNEMDMLMSMFVRDGELIMDDPSALADIRDLVASDPGGPLSDGAPGTKGEELLETGGQIGFTVKLLTENKHTIEMVFRLPHSYPASSPDVSIRSSLLSRFHHEQFNEAICCFIGQLKTNEPVIFEIVQWIRDNADTYIEHSIRDNADNRLTPTRSSNSLSTGNLTFCRFWIYSHHIYNKEKRKNIISLADELDLTGFSVPGKPGIICVEGEERNVDDFWSSVRSMQWKKISLVHREAFPIERNSSALQQLRKFTDFEEKHFDPRPGRGREVHMDLGLLRQFLQQNGLGDVFSIYFGVSGKEATHDTDEHMLPSLGRS